MTQYWVILDKDNTVLEQVITPSLDIHPSQSGNDCEGKTVIPIDAKGSDLDVFDIKEKKWKACPVKSEKQYVKDLNRYCKNSSLDVNSMSMFYMIELTHFHLEENKNDVSLKNKYPWVNAISNEAGISLPQAFDLIDDLLGNEMDRLKTMSAIQIVALNKIKKTSSPKIKKQESEKAIKKIKEVR